MDPLDAARAVLPLWVAWAPLFAAALLTFAGAFALVWLVQWPARRSLRRSGALHWSERARTLWPWRQGGAFALFALPAFASVFSDASRPLLLAGPRPLLHAATALAAFLGAALGLRVLERRVRPAPLWGVGEFLGSRLVGLLLIIPHLLLALLLGLLTPQAWTPGASLVWGAGMALLLTVCLVGALPLLWLARALRPASPRLVACMGAASAATGVRPRRLLQLRWFPANAVAYPVLQAVVVSERALHILSDDELTAILAHELGHLTEPTPLRAVRWATGAGMAVPLACVDLLQRALGPPGLLLAFGAFLLVPLLARRALSQAEVHADGVAHGAAAHGVAHGACGGEASYARALERLHADGLMPAMLATRASIHPPLYERMLAAGVTPDFPRPAPPSRAQGPLVMLAVVGLAMVAGMGGLTLLALAQRAEGADEASLLRALAVSREAAPLAELARLREAQGRTPEALALIAAASQREPRCASHAAMHIRLLARTGDCTAAVDRARAHTAFLGERCEDPRLEERRWEDEEQMLEALAGCDPEARAPAPARSGASLPAAP